MRQIHYLKHGLVSMLACCCLMGCSADAGLRSEQALQIAAESNCAQVAGIWDVSEQVVSGDCSGVGQSIDYSYIIVQKGCEVQIQDSEALGTVEGNLIRWQAHTVGKDPGIRGMRYYLLVQPYEAEIDGDNLKYQCQWRYTRYDDTDACSGKSAMNAVRLVR